MKSHKKAVFPRAKTRIRQIVDEIIKRKRMITSLILAFCHLLGALTSVKAIMETRTSAGAIAWAISLNTFPYVSVPAYWIFGRSKFKGYVKARRQDIEDLDEILREVGQYYLNKGLLRHPDRADRTAVEKLALLPIVKFNDAHLLIDGEAAFDAIFKIIDEAKTYILVQFYIIRDDALGQKLKSKLMAKAAGGVAVYFLYDEIGSHRLPKAYLRELASSGVRVAHFNTTQGTANRFQLNFRNHRKMVVADGKKAVVSGHNVGIEYLGQNPKYGFWRDTGVKVTGPIVPCVQLAFAEDWHWATKETPDLNWFPDLSKKGSMDALVLPSGPADRFETCGLFFERAIHTATERIWIASPYFVPDESIISALQLAGLRGVDVRILLPEKPDHILVNLSSFSYLEELEKANVKILRYRKGFLHQKVMLVDRHFSTVGTANFDNRSFRLNFEIILAFDDKAFAKEMEGMFLADFKESRPVSAKEFTDRSFFFRLGVRIARLMAPIQ